MDRLYGTLLKAVQNSLNHCNYENALFLCSRAESLCPRRPEAMYYRALSLFQEGQPMAAYGLLVLSENIKTGLHLSSAFLLARVCFELGKLQEAERLLVDLLSRLDSCVSADIHKLIPQVDPAEAYHLLGRIQRRTNRTQNAIVSFQRAFELNPLAWESFKELCELGALDGLEEDKDWFTMERIGAWMDEISSKEAPVKPRATTGTSKAASTTGPKRRVGTATTTVLATSRKRVRDQDLPMTNVPQETVSLVAERDTSDFMRSINVIANGYMRLANLECEKAQTLFESLDEEELESSGWVQSQLGRLFYEKNEYKEAERHFTKQRQIEPYLMVNMDIYGTCLWHLRKDVDLGFLAKELEALDPHAPQTWCVVGNLFSRTLEHDQAIRSFQKAVDYEPYFAYAHTLMGHEYMLNEDLDRAGTSFRNAIRAHSRHYNSWYGLALVFMKQEKYLLAEYHFKKALEIHPSNPLLQSHVAMVVQKDSNRLDEALARFEAAEQLAPEQPMYTFRKAHTLALMGRFEDALSNLQSLVGLNVAECNIHYLMGRLNKQLGKKREAIRCLTLAQDNLSNKATNLIKEALEHAEKIGDCEEITAEDLKLFE